MKRSLLLLIAALAVFGCSEIRNLTDRDDDPYKNPFYAKYLNTGSQLDEQITRTLDAVRNDPKSAQLHNELGSLLVQKGFPKDALREFERAIDLDGKYYPAWYNLGLIRAAQGDEGGARRAYARTVSLKPGHSAALFQLGLIEEKLQHIDRAVALYAKAYGINPSLLEVQVNPRILDSKLTTQALMKLYPTAHARESMQFQGVPQLPQVRRPVQAPSPEATPQQIITPAPPATDPSMQPASVAPPAASVTAPSAPARGRRPRRRVPPPDEPVPATTTTAPPAETTTNPPL